MEEQREIEDMNQTQQTPQMVNNTLFLQHRENHSNNKEAEEGKQALPEEASIHTAEMTAIKIALREIQKREKT